MDRTLDDGRGALAVRLAREAGDLLMGHLGRLSGYEHKGRVNLVTEADRASQALIDAQIRKKFPDDAVVGEESGLSREGCSGFSWVVDPLDGTTNFVHGFPLFGVSIAVLLDGACVHAAISCPPQGEVFSASRGGGALLNGEPVRVSTVTELSKALVATGFPYDRYLPERADSLLGYVRHALVTCQGLRRGGAAAVDMAWVGCGRLDAYWEEGLKGWDLAAGGLFVSEAGGRVTDFDGGAFDPWTGRVAATNGHVHQAFLDALALPQHPGAPRRSVAGEPHGGVS